jgi:hypothetical protein
MTQPATLDDLWKSAPPPKGTFQTEQAAGYPDAIRRYLNHAIAPGTPLASAVRLRMHGEIRLRGWWPFSAEEVISWGRGKIWRAAVRKYGIRISGSDRFAEGAGAMEWKLFGTIPFLSASGPDITRSAAGRLNIESIWLPSVLCRESVSWTALDPSRFRAGFTAHNQRAELECAVDGQGRLTSIVMPRWGNPGGGDFRYVDFGGFAEAEAEFSGFTIPTQMRIGWHCGTGRFEPEGEFFRVTIDEATYASAPAD